MSPHVTLYGSRFTFQKGEIEMSSPNETSSASGEETTVPGPPEPPQDSTLPAPSDETLVGASASAETSRSQIPLAPDAQSIHNQDTVVSPRLRQLATTPSQPLRPPPGAPPRKPPSVGSLAGESSSRLRLLIGIVAVLVLLALILVGALLATQGPALMARLNPTKTPTPTPTLAATPTSAFPPTFTPTRVPPTQVPTPVPPTATPRPAPSAIALDVLAKVTPPESIKLKVRESPSAGAAIRGELDKDAQVAIIEGPQQANGLTWWKVDDGKGLVGWSAEGVGNEKYLVPIGWAK
jgi:hypothetical protein